MNSDDILAGLPRATPRHRHRWNIPTSGSTATFIRWGCVCGAVRDPQKSRRGKTARRRGNDYERDVASRLGAKRVGQYGSSVDVGGGGDWIAAQVKNGGAFPERIWRWLQELPHDSQHVRAVVIGDAPGAGRKRREVIVLDFSDFCRWFGK